LEQGCQCAKLPMCHTLRKPFRFRSIFFGGPTELGRIINAAGAVTRRYPPNCPAAINQEKENARTLRIGWQPLLGDVMLSLSRHAVHDRKVLLLGPAAHTTTEAPRHAHQWALSSVSSLPSRLRHHRPNPPGLQANVKCAFRIIRSTQSKLADQQVGVSKPQRVGRHQGQPPKRFGDVLGTAPQGPFFSGAVPEQA
jgi:hypothetical protein